MEKRGKKAQIWVETVTYTLIGLAIMAILLAVMLPKINSTKDKAIIDQTVIALSELKQQIDNTLVSAGNKRHIVLGIKKGEYLIDSKNDAIIYTLKGSKLIYSQLNQSIPLPTKDISILTRENKGRYDISLTLNISPLNLTYNLLENDKIITSSPTPYSMSVMYIGGADNKLNIEPL